jgi:hypothetical protein
MRRHSLRTLALSAILFSQAVVLATPCSSQPIADVVVVVDTSTSMKQPGMDPERTSLLVTKLLADIVPGELAAVRLLDLVKDAKLLPGRQTNTKEPCQEDPTRLCNMVEPASDWHEDARSGRFGALVRLARGDAAFKAALDGHLAQVSNNSPFSLAFRAAQGVLDTRPKGATDDRKARTVIWLSDGRDDNPAALQAVIRELQAEGVAIEAIVFGRGDPTLGRQAGLDVRLASSPGELMKAFAGAFRRIVQAPYEVDNVVAAEPRFEVKRSVDEAWVVVYGDDTLGTVQLLGPAGKVPASYATDRWAGAGAYKVAHLTRPPAGTWTVQAEGGGSKVAYAVVQWSALSPTFLAPRTAISGTPETLVAGVQAGNLEEVLTDRAVLSDLSLEATAQGTTIALNDEGLDGDEIAGDGRFSGTATLRGSGFVPVQIRLKNALVDRAVEAQIELSGAFHYRGPPIPVDFGRLRAGEESCRPVTLAAEHQGEVPFEVRVTGSLPADHRLVLRSADHELHSGGAAVGLMPTSPFELCLITSKRAPSSKAQAEPWLELAVSGSSEADQRVPFRLTWEVEGLSFWDRWKWVILGLLAVLVALFLAGGYILPNRFSGTLALTFVPDRGELEEHSPQPVKQWRGVGIGFYRSARAYLHADFRLSGSAQGALASLAAERTGARVEPGKGNLLARETLEGGWEPVAPPGRRVRAGDVYRIGDRGPFFRITTHRGRA